MCDLTSDMVKQHGNPIDAPSYILGFSNSGGYDQWARSRMYTADEKTRKSVLNTRGDFVLEGAPVPGGSVMPSIRLTHAQETEFSKGAWKALAALLKEDQ